MEKIELTYPEGGESERLDQFVSRTVENLTRSAALRLIENGNKFICTDLALSFLDKLQQEPSVPQQFVSIERKPNDLSNREIEVLRLIAEGLTNAEIADKLFTSKRTIESHRQNIIEKTQVKNTAALIKYALNNGIID